MPAFFFTVALGYFVGAIPFGYLAGKLNGLDVRLAGSGNIGATNVGRLLGRRWGLAVFILDLSKGLAGVLVGRELAGDMAVQWPALLPVIGGLSAFFGHLFPIYLRFKGGKGVATGAGVALGLLPGWCLEAMAIWALFTLCTRTVSAGSLAASAWLAGHSALALITDPVQPVAWFGVLGGGLVIVKHRANLTRLLADKENLLADAQIFRTAPPALHLLAVGAWLAIGGFVTFVAGLGLFERFRELSAPPTLSRPYWLPIPGPMANVGPGPAAGLPEPLWVEQGGILAGHAVSVLFGPYFHWQAGLGLVVFATAWRLSRRGNGGVPRIRLILSGCALVGALAGNGIEQRVESLRLDRYAMTEEYLRDVADNSANDTPVSREHLRQIRARFGSWHSLSVAANLATLLVVAGLLLLGPGALLQVLEPPNGTKPVTPWQPFQQSGSGTVQL